MALKDHEWKGIPRAANEIYTIDAEDVRFDALLAMGLAKLVDPIEPESQPAGRYNRRDLRPKR